MADPITLMALSAGVQTVGSAVTGVAKYASSKRDAALARRNGDISRQSAAVEGANLTRRAEKAVGAAKARAGASGFTLAGSATDVIAQLAAEGAQGAAAATYDGFLRGQGFDEQAKQADQKAKFGAIASAFEVVGGVLTGAGNFKKAKAA